MTKEWHVCLKYQYIFIDAELPNIIPILIPILLQFERKFILVTFLTSDRAGWLCDNGANKR